MRTDISLPGLFDNPIGILWPVLVHLALIQFLFVMVSLRRLQAVRQNQLDIDLEKVKEGNYWTATFKESVPKNTIKYTCYEFVENESGETIFERIVPYNLLKSFLTYKKVEDAKYYRWTSRLSLAEIRKIRSVSKLKEIKNLV